jgi:hypothetical protein
MSNLLALGAFKMEDRVSKGGGTIRYVNKHDDRYLEIVPEIGWIRYWDNKATDTYKKPIEGVPDQVQAEEGALALLAKVGISRSDFATQPGSSKLLTFGERGTNERLDKATSKRKESVYTRGVFFIRQVDGVNFAGIGVNGGAHVTFSLNGRVSWFETVWRNLKRFEHQQVLTQEQLLNSIKEGQAVMTHRNEIDSAAIKRLTIKEVAPLYMGESAQTKQDFIFPFAQLEAVADLGTNSVPLQLYCSILAK